MAEPEDIGSLESGDFSKPELKILKEKVEELQHQEKDLIKEKKQLEDDFGQKRAQFKELFLQKEEELKATFEQKQESENKNKSLEEELERVKTELQDIKAAVAFSEENKEFEVGAIRRQCKEEVDTLQSLLKDVANEASESTAVQYETEREKLQLLNQKYEEELEELRGKLQHERESSILSSVANAIKRVGVGAGLNTSSEAENLEDSMRRAQEDSDMLKSVVLPLEEEIEQLKEKLRIAEEMMKSQNLPISNSVMADATPKSKSMPMLDSKSVPEHKNEQNLEERILELMHDLKTEKASRVDLEMYVAVQSTQKNVLQDDVDKLKEELEEVCSMVDSEKRSHENLKQTWQMANDQFLESQRLMMMDMRRMESLLSSEQQRQIAELQRQDQEREIQQRKVKELEEMRLKQEQAQEEIRKLGTKLKIKEAKAQAKMKKTKSVSKGSINSNTGSVDDLLNFEEGLENSIKRSLSSSEILQISEKDNFVDSGVHETRSLHEVDGMTLRISPDKVINMPSLTDDQMRAITDRTPEIEARRSLLDSVKTSKRDRISMEGRRLVSEKEWELLQQEVKSAREKLGRPCDMCSNYEAQLQTVQQQLKREEMKAKSAEHQLETEQTIADNRQRYVLDLETKLKDTAEDTQKQISSLITHVQECEKFLTGVKQQSILSQQELQEQLRTFTESREIVQKELVRLQEENEALMGKHSKHAQQLQNEDINLPDSLEEMQLLLLKYREDIISAKVSQEHTEDTLKSEILFLKDRLLAEQQEKNTMEESLTQEINSLQEKLVVQESLKTELERESSVRAEVETKFRESEQALKGLQAKSRQLTKALQQQLEEQSNARTKLENEVGQLKAKVQSLQLDLDNSEAVQRDFVKLSQSLQIQLEKIRQAENEVRWEHEEDVEDCNTCKQQFTVTKRKHHCRHCGKIFCADCCSKTVNSGVNMRSSRVCDVCHTILVKDAMPYFSSEPPATPD
ncbi:hypothetical protein ScPMuIL_006449 [Solemya velum]